MDRLDCIVMPYAWGSRTAIAELTGRVVPSAGPEAELWMGAHPLGSSRVRRDVEPAALSEIIAAHPIEELGERSVRAFGPRLPFLLKVLAAAEPLSLQAHPTASQAVAGFEHEEEHGVARDAPSRNYKDASHKPELLCALTPFDALCGFRRADESARLFDALAVRELDAVLAPLRTSRDASGIEETFRLVMTMPAAERGAAVAALVDACASYDGPLSRECRWASRLAELYPGDAGVVSALLLNLVRLEPGEAVYLGAGNLHAYLEGVGVEIMASSDNVLRGGLTKKHVDLPELMRVLDFRDGPITPLRARRLDESEEVYDTPAQEFRLSRLSVAPKKKVQRQPCGPEILLVASGRVRAGALWMTQGESVFVPASSDRYELEGEGVIYRATTNLVA